MNSFCVLQKRTVKFLAINILVWIGVGFATVRAQTVALSPGVEDVGKLASAKVNDDVILAFVRNSRTPIQLTSDDIIYLNTKGVSSSVMAALLQSPGIGATTTDSTSPPASTSHGTPAAQINYPSPSSPKVTYYPGGPAPTTADAGPAPLPAAAPVDGSAAGSPQVDMPYFQQQLSPYGSWVTVPEYGMVWRPGIALRDPDWRPYCQGGHWVYTDAGWYWQADDPWGSVVFHYGRWTIDPAYGWFWVPGYNWAPSWVCWRHSPGYYGWAPLPPHAEYVVGVGLRYRGVAVGVDFDFGIGYQAYTFVGYDHLWVHDYRAYYVPHERVEIVFRSSQMHNGYREDHGRFVVEGFGRDHVAIHTGVRVEVVDVHHQMGVEHGAAIHNVSSPHNVDLRSHVAAQQQPHSAPTRTMPAPRGKPAQHP